MLLEDALELLGPERRPLHLARARPVMGWPVGRGPDARDEGVGHGVSRGSQTGEDRPQSRGSGGWGGGDQVGDPLSLAWRDCPDRGDRRVLDELAAGRATPRLDRRRLRRPANRVDRLADRAPAAQIRGNGRDRSRLGRWSRLGDLGQRTVARRLRDRGERLAVVAAREPRPLPR